MIIRRQHQDILLLDGILYNHMLYCDLDKCACHKIASDIDDLDKLHKKDKPHKALLSRIMSNNEIPFDDFMSVNQSFEDATV